MKKRGASLEILGVGTTGYGEQLFANAFSAECHVVETVAHARAAAKYVPGASFILDIGGQDMKAIWLKDGIITNIVVNEACHGLALVILRPCLEAYLPAVAGHLPQLLTHVGSEGGEHQQQGLHVAPAGTVGIEVVDQGHQGGNGGIELHGLDILRHLFDGLVDSGLVGLGVLLAGVLLLGGQVPHPVQEALATTDGVVGPNRCLFKVADEHDIQAHGVRAVIPDHVVGVDHVAQRLGHLDRGTQGLIAVLFNECLLLLLGLHIAHIMGVLAQDHAVAGALA